MNNWILLSALVSCSAAGYYHQPSARQFSTPGQLFGFSVSSMHRGKDAKLIVGDPTAPEIGKVFTCNLNSREKGHNDCTPVNVANITRSPQTGGYENQSYWLGATVKGADDYFIICAPLRLAYFVLDENRYWKNGVGVYGRCFKYNTDGQLINEMSTIPDNIRKGNAIHLEHTMDTFGWAADIDKDGSILIGGPAMQFEGRVHKYQEDKSKTKTDVTGAEFNTNFNFGYSLASGYFTRKSLFHAVGSPYGSDGEGRVSFMDDDMNNRTFHLLGEGVGSMFGAALCAGTLVRCPQGSADLLVGAPTYAADKQYNIGAVYIYTGNIKGPVYRGKLVGTSSQSFFGSAIANVGDLNGDKLDEFAVAAPYESEGHGAVYLYSGANLAKADKDTSVPYLQKLEASDPKPMSFGFSLSVIQDYDDNGFNELAIGAPLSNLVSVYSCVAAITLKLLPLPKLVSNDGKGQTVPLAVCFNVEYPEKPRKVKATIIVELTIYHSRAELQEPSGRFIFGNLKSDNLRSNKTHQTDNCQTALLVLPADGNYEDAIQYKLTARLETDPFKSRKFEGSHVTLTDRSVVDLYDSIMASECNETCAPILIHSGTTFTPDITSYVIGSSDRVVADILIKNEGDVAYDPCIHVGVPRAPAPLELPLPKGCQEIAGDSDIQEIECTPRQLLRASWTLSLPLNTTMLTSNDKSISMIAKLFSHCRTPKELLTITQEIKLHSDTDGVAVTGVTDDGKDDNVNLTRSDIIARKGFQHVYSIRNLGLTNWVNFKIFVTVQKLSFINKIVSMVNETSGIEACIREEENTATSETYVCVARQLSKNTGIEVKILMTGTPEQLFERISSETLTVSSNLTIDQIDNKSAGVTSTLRLREAKVEIWVIALATIIALIVLVIFFFILRECGFLRRKNKENLRRARLSVKRQTVIRSSRHSMMNRQQAEDQAQLMEVPSEYLPKSGAVKWKKDRRVVIDS